MTVLRSREVASVIQKEHLHKPVKSGDEIEPSTPAKEVELTNKSLYEATPSPNKLLQSSDKLGSVGSSDSGSISNQGLRRSSRLSLKSSSHNVVENVGFRKRRKVVNRENGEAAADAIHGLGFFVEDGNEKESGGSERVASNVRVLRGLDAANSCEANGVLVYGLGEKEGVQSVKKVNRQSLQSIDARLLGSELVQEGDVVNGCLKLRSGKKLVKPGFNDVANDRKRCYGEEDEKEKEGIESEAGDDTVGEGSSVIEAEGSRGNRNVSEKTWTRFSIEDKKKGVLVDGDDHGGSDLDKKIKIRAGEELERINKTKVEEETENDINDTIKMDISRLGIEEKGKGKLVKVDSLSNCSDIDDLSVKPDVGSTIDNTLADTASLEQASLEEAGPSTKSGLRERFKNVARASASRFAYFSMQEEEDPVVDEVELELSQSEANMDVEDWPGPFSTAMKIIKERASNMPAQQTNLTSEKSHSVPLIWVPKEKQRDHVMKAAPSLQELCMKIMAENVDAIISLESVPDVLRHKLTQLLCDCRKMNNHFFDLLARGSPSEIRIRDCSWLDEEQFTKTFGRTDTSNLTVLQLDQCGRCLPDYVLYTTLSPVPSKLSALTNVSLKGACRLSDAGLKTLIASAPALRSINLGCCSLLTSDAIVNLADKLGPILKELYIDECFGIDPMHILSALSKLEHLEVLSISRFETVNDSFIRKFVAVRGQNMKELVLANCTKLTDNSLKAIAESCPGLCTIDLTNLCKLTDTAIGYLANGCQAIQTMKFCRNAFSDEAVAAYLEASGKPLKELSLNHVDKVANHTALSLAKHAKNLHSLDLSWCRNMTDEALGLIVDSCLSLKMLKLFGCTQITNVFTDGHSNEAVKIVGLRGSQILKNIETPDLVPLRYSSAV